MHMQQKLAEKGGHWRPHKQKSFQAVNTANHCLGHWMLWLINTKVKKIKTAISTASVGHCAVLECKNAANDALTQLFMQ
jgi:hypothetical protein